MRPALSQVHRRAEPVWILAHFFWRPVYAQAWPNFFIIPHSAEFVKCFLKKICTNFSPAICAFLLWCFGRRCAIIIDEGQPESDLKNKKIFLKKCLTDLLKTCYNKIYQLNNARREQKVGFI